MSIFQREVYNIVSSIPYGKTCSYEQVAKALGTSPRAVGRALAKNPLPILIPCHRVIRKDGGLGGYIGGRELKKMILEIEKSACSSDGRAAAS